MRTLMILSVFALSACGISDGTVVTDLDSGDAQKLCEEFPERVVKCESDGFEFEITLGGDCANASVGDAPATCTATVGDYRDCQGAWAGLSDEDVCNLDGFPAECDAFFTSECVTAE